MDPYKNTDPNIFYEILINIPKDELKLFFKLSDRIKTVTKDNEAFWKDKTEYDYPKCINVGKISWKLFYKQCSGKIYSFGSNIFGQLGYDNTDYVKNPTLISNSDGATHIASFATHSAIVINKSLYTFGNNICGQLGHGHVGLLTVPTLVPNLENVIHVSCGCVHTAVIANDHLYTFGWNRYGQLGNDCVHSSTPICFSQFKNPTYVACGYYYTAVIENGNLYTFGDNANYQLGHDHNKDLFVPTHVPNLKNVTHVACGLNHTVVIANGNLYTFGCNKYGQLIHNENKLNVPTMILSCLTSSNDVLELKNITHISCGKKWTSLIINKKLYVFGKLYGIQQRGLVLENIGNISYIVSNQLHSAVISNKKLYTFSRDNIQSDGKIIPYLVPDLDNVKCVSIGHRYNIVLCS
jgi:hypothetical protein